MALCYLLGNVAFLRAMKTPEDELAGDTYRKLEFIHFVEALLRVADKTADDDVDETPDESAVDLMARVKDAFPSAAEKRKRAALEAEREKQERHDAKKQQTLDDAAAAAKSDDAQSKKAMANVASSLLAAKKAAKHLGAKAKGRRPSGDENSTAPRSSMMSALGKKAAAVAANLSSIPMAS